MMGHEIALQIRLARDEGKALVLILPVGPMGMYRWAVYFLKEWSVPCSHVYGFNMDEWSDAEGNTLDPSDPGAFQNAMQQAFYGPLGALTVPENRRYFATRTLLPTYPERIARLKQDGARLVTVFGIGRVFHIAFWEPHFAAEFSSLEEWKRQAYRLGAKLHPLTIEQNAITSFKSRTTLVPCRANTIGPGLFLQSDRDHRRVRRHARARHAVAGHVLVGDPALRAGSLGAVELHAHAARASCSSCRSWPGLWWRSAIEILIRSKDETWCINSPQRRHRHRIPEGPRPGLSNLPAQRLGSEPLHSRYCPPGRRSQPETPGDDHGLLVRMGRPGGLEL